MKKTRRVISLSLIAILSTTVILCGLAFAGILCPECGQGTIIRNSWTETNVAERKCPHHTYGTDLYQVTTSITEGDCTNCVYGYYTSTPISSVLLECHGYE